jgi:hypothetical protein
MNAHGRSEAFTPEREARRESPISAHGRSEAFSPEREARRAPR